MFLIGLSALIIAINLATMYACLWGPLELSPKMRMFALILLAWSSAWQSIRIAGNSGSQGHLFLLFGVIDIILAYLLIGMSSIDRAPNDTIFGITRHFENYQ